MRFIVKNTTFPRPIDLVAPHYCRGCEHIGEPLCHRCKNNIVLDHTNRCPNCNSPNPLGKCPKCSALPPTFVVGDRTDLIGELLYELKYNSVRAMARPIAEILNELLPSVYGEVRVVPLPTIGRHIRERGIDHTSIVAKHFAKLRGKDYKLEKVLVRANNTVQVGADRKKRIAQAASAYAISPKITIDPTKTYILYDDVWTTGASIKAAVKLLRESGAEKIMVVILARAVLK